ncbi:MAG: hypothetical protein BWY28_02419 [bacterium ADurb.Bin236]|nr:MAG: hypothetical protein BWY28_02419 [bacterium ADurb.Bin236]
MDDDPIGKIERFINEENCYVVMGQFRRLGVLTKADIHKAMGMKRVAWINFMKEKAGIAGQEIKAEGERNVE